MKDADWDLPTDLEKEEGRETICPFCDTYVICRRMHDGRLSWRNENGSYHFSFSNGNYKCHPHNGA